MKWNRKSTATTTLIVSHPITAAASIVVLVFKIVSKIIFSPFLTIVDDEAGSITARLNLPLDLIDHPHLRNNWQFSLNFLDSRRP